MNKTIYGSIAWFIVTLFVVYSFCLSTAAAVFSESIKNTLHVSNVNVSIGVGAFIIGFALMQIMLMTLGCDPNIKATYIYGEPAYIRQDEYATCV